MNWQSFFAMSGYGWYVWGSFGMCFALMAAEMVSLGLRSRSLQGLHKQRKTADLASFTNPLPGSAQ